MQTGKIGVIIHWGLYSVVGYDNPKSARRRKIQNGSEWILRRLTETQKYRPVSGWKESQEYFDQKYGTDNIPDREKSYFNLKLNTDEWDPNKWAEFFVKNKVDYVILTSKHHDGFCLWPTETRNQAKERDLVGEFVKAMKAAKIKVGLYYSWYEFQYNLTKDIINRVIIPQVRELQKYEPEIYWFDGQWGIKSAYAKEKITELVMELKTTAEVNDRIPNVLDASYRVFSDRFIPEKKFDYPWEHVNTIGLSWGYNRAQEDNEYKTSEQLYKLYKKVKKRGGNFLINFGPNRKGNFHPKEIEAFEGFTALVGR